MRAATGVRIAKLAVLGLLLAPGPARAHDVDVTSVARVFLDEIGDRRYLLSVVDAKVPPITDPQGALPARCAPVAPEDVEIRVAAGFVFECETPLTGEDVLVLPWPLAGVVVLARWAEGPTASAYFRGGQGRVRVTLGELRAEPGSRARLAATYLGLGAEHILLGVDHLLFVLGLLLLVRGFIPLVKTVTAFTVAHSITLAASVLGYIPLDRAPIEAAIALSIVLLAREIVVADRGLVHLTHRKPWVVAFVFGLLHGLGFAGALGEIGLPASAIPLALLFFNLGVEAGQLAFVVVLLVLHRLLHARLQAALPRMKPALGYSLGALAALWFFERLPAIWGS
ncbi:MAG TPA: HupE/UreJ family protein [Longimicrobiales bacterium]|nr:HupE/UreJ family protein [Longimicrobiales bacterium]